MSIWRPGIECLRMGVGRGGARVTSRAGRARRRGADHVHAHVHQAARGAPAHQAVRDEPHHAAARDDADAQDALRTKEEELARAMEQIRAMKEAAKTGVDKAAPETTTLLDST